MDDSLIKFLIYAAIGFLIVMNRHVLRDRRSSKITPIIDSVTSDDSDKKTHQALADRKKDVLKTVTTVISFYVVAIIISLFVPEESLKLYIILQILPSLATVAYGFWVARKRDLLMLKVVFYMFLALQALKVIDRLL